jgi:hypothetical protein
MILASRRTLLTASALAVPLSTPWVTSRAQSAGTLNVVLPFPTPHSTPIAANSAA